MKKIGRLLGMLLLLFSFSTVAFGETLRVAIPADPDTFDSHKTTAAATWEVAFNVLEGLVKANAQGDIVPGLAHSYTIDPDQKVYTFYLREAYFHTGERVTPLDVIAALNRARDPAFSARSSEYEVIESIQAEGDGIVISLKHPYGPFLASLTEIAATIYPKGSTNQQRNPIGTGPYQFAEWRPNQHVKLTRFPLHWGEDEPYFSTVFFQVMPDDTSQVLALKTGHVDLIPRLEPSLLPLVERDLALQVLSSPMNLVQILAVNHKRAPFDDLSFRRALGYALDREEVILGAAFGYGTPLVSGLSPAMDHYYHGELELQAKNIARANALIAESGYDGRTLVLDLPAAYPLHVRAGEIIAASLRSLGLPVEIRIVEWGTWLERVYRQRDYDLTIVGLAGRLDPYAVLVRYQSESSRNFFNFQNEAFDALLQEVVESSPSKRQELYYLAQEILAKEVAGIFIMDPHQLTVIRKDIQGFRSYPVYVTDVSALYRE